MKTGGKIVFENRLAITREYPDGTRVVQGKRQGKAGVDKEIIAAYVKRGIVGIVKVFYHRDKLSLRDAYENAKAIIEWATYKKDA